MAQGLFNKMVDAASKLVSSGRVTNLLQVGKAEMFLAEVIDKNQLYTAYIGVNGNDTSHCDCETFLKEGICPHILAGELTLMMNGVETAHFLSQKESQKNKMPRNLNLNLFKREAKRVFFQAEEGDIFMEVSLVLRESSYYNELPFEAFVSMKIGKKKLFVVKHIPDLITAYEYGHLYALGKSDAIDFSYVHLSKLQIDLLECLKRIVMVEESSQRPGAKFTTVHPALVPELVAVMTRMDMADTEVVLADRYSNDMEDTYVLDEWGAQPLTIQMSQAQDGSYLIQLKNRRDWLYFPGFYLLKDMFQIGLVPSSQDGAYQAIFETLYYEDLVIKEESHLIEFLSYALPVFKEVAKLEIADQLKERLVYEAAPRIAVSTNKHDVVVRLNQAQGQGATVRALDQGGEPGGERDKDEKDKLQEAKPDALVLKDIAKRRALAHDLSKKGYSENIDGSFSKPYRSQKDLLELAVRDVKSFKTFGQVEVSDDLTLSDMVFKPVISLHQNGSLLDIDFSIEGISQEDVTNILQSIEEKEPVYQLDNGHLVDLTSESFYKVHKVLDSIRGRYKKKGKTLQTGRLQALQVAYENGGEDLELTDDLKTLVQDLIHPENFPAQLPQGLQAQLKDYQVLGFKWLKMLAHHQLGGILADDMGLGKTMQTIAFMLSQVEEGKNQGKPFLIVAPASVIFNWKHELAQFAPSLKTSVVAGSKQDRLSLLEDKTVQVFITSYQTFRSDQEDYKDLKWHALILDESQMVKNYATKQHKSLRDVKTDIFFALSGTPIENRKEDFWSIFSLVLPGLFPSLKEYKKLDDGQIARMAQPFVLRRLKKDVLTELPEKIESVLYSDLTSKQKALYLGYLQRIQDQVQSYSSEDFQKHRIEILSGLTRLRQICCHPSLFVDNYTGDSGKLDQFLDVVSTALSNGHRLLVFSQFSSMLDILKAKLAEQGYDAFLLTGQTPAKERMDMIQAYNQGQHDIFLISLRAGGMGINLTSADTIILYDLWWNPAVEEQAMGRAHRIGQKNSVHVYRMVTEGTIEEKIMALQQKKKDLFDTMVISENQADKSRQQLTDDDIKEILGLGS